MKSQKNILITGGAGFIGSHVVRKFLNTGKHTIVNLDKLTYAGNLENLRDVENFNEWKNIDLVNLLCDLMNEKLTNLKRHSRKLITFVKDRVWYDLRYAIDASKIKKN